MMLTNIIHTNFSVSTILLIYFTADWNFSMIQYITKVTPCIFKPRPVFSLDPPLTLITSIQHFCSVERMAVSYGTLLL